MEDCVELSLTGFEIPEIDIVLGDAKIEEDPADQLPALTAEAVSRPGDLWCLGKHRILCGDARSDEAYTLLMRGRRAAAVFADPPYNVVIDGHASGNGRTRHGEFAMASGEMNMDEFTEFLTTCLMRLSAWSTNGSLHYVCMDWRHMQELQKAGRRAYDTLLNVCVWVKDNGGMGSFYRSQHELIFVFRNGKAMHRNNVVLGKYGRYRTNVWRYPGASTLSRSADDGNVLAMHPTVKGIALIADALLDCSARGELILDPFLGAGTTLLASERTGRICYGMEIEPNYVDLTIRRWQKFTGQAAIHAVSKREFGEMEMLEVRHA